MADVKWKKAVDLLLRQKAKDPFLLEGVQEKDLLTCDKSELLVVSYPDCGSDVLSTLLEMILVEQQKKVPARYIPFYEHMPREEQLEMRLSANNEISIRQSNLRYQHLYAKVRGKMIYVMKDPEEAAFSTYNKHFSQQMPLRKFLDVFIRGDSPYNYKEHFMQFMNNVANRDIFAFKIDDLENKPLAALKDLFDFLGIQLWLPDHTILDMIGKCQVAKETTTWNTFANLLAVKELGTYMDDNVRRCFSRDLKINWKIVTSTVIPKG